VLTDDELGRLLAAATDWDRPLLELTARTGLRKGEALGVIWSEVAFEDSRGGSLSITHQLDRLGRRVRPKTDRSVRTVDLSPQTAARLREHRLASPRSGDHDLVFVRRTGQPYSHQAAHDAMARAIKGAGLAGIKRGDEWIVAPLSFHSLRHTHISRLIAAGWDVQEIADRAGDTVGTILTEYAHTFDAARRQQSRRDRLGAMETFMETAQGNDGQQTATATGADVASLSAKRSARR
jgi:integrase